MVPPLLRVMFVDDHAVVREALAALVTGAADMVVCGEAASVQEAEKLAEELEPDVVILDLRLGDGSGIAASRRIRDHRPATQVILLTGASDDDALCAAILAGAAAYVPKQLRGIDLIGTIRAVSAGARLLDQGDIDRVVSGQSERRLLSLLVQGRTDHDLRRILGLEEAALQDRLDQLKGALCSFRCGGGTGASTTMHDSPGRTTGRASA